MNFVVPDFYPAAAELFVAGMSLIILMVTVFAGQAGRNWAYFLTQATLVAAAFITIGTLDGQVVTTFSNMYVDDLMGDLLKLLIYFSVAVALLYGRGYLAERGMDRIEYYLLALYMTLGMMVMVSAAHFLSLYIGLELLSLSLYGMVAFDRDSARSTEAAMKYFVLGALASGLLLYGMSMIYGATGSLELGGVAQSIYHQAANREVLMFGLVFVVAGLAFKLGVVPFHMWVPDVYHGAPSAVTLLIASAPKLAAFAMAMRLLGNVIQRYQNRSIETAQVMEELVDMVQKFREAANRGERPGLSEDEVRFYDALATNASAVRELTDETLKKIAHELTENLRQNLSVDWSERESVRARLRLMVKRILRKYKYPPDQQDAAVDLVLRQAQAIGEAGQV